jgi:hypothetical protein
MRLMMPVIIFALVILWLNVDWPLALAVEIVALAVVIFLLVIASRRPVDKRTHLLLGMLNSELFIWQGVMSLKRVTVEPQDLRDSARLLELRKRVGIQMAVTAVVFLFFALMLAFEGNVGEFGESSARLPVVLLSMLPLILASLIAGAFLRFMLSEEYTRWKRNEQLGYEVGAIPGEMSESG